MLLLLFAGASSTTPTPATHPAVGWIGRLRHTHRELEERLKRQKDSTFSRRWFDEYLAAEAKALERAEQTKSEKLREALQEAVETAAEAAHEAFEEGREIEGLTEALNAAASAGRLTASLKHAQRVMELVEANDDEEVIELLLLH